MHKKHSFLLRILTPLSLLCDVDWHSYGSSSGLRSIFKSCEASHSISILSSVMHDYCMCEYPFESGLNRGFCNFQNSTLIYYITHNLIKQHRRAMEEVSNAKKKTALFMHVFHCHRIFQFLIYLLVYRYFLCAVY